jgi:hypothetical protein
MGGKERHLTLCEEVLVDSLCPDQLALEGLGKAVEIKQEKLPGFPHGLRLCDPPELGWERTPDDAA